MNYPGKKRSVGEIAEHVRATIRGDAHVEVTAVSSIASATPSSLVFVEDEKNLQLAFDSPAAAVIAGDFFVGANAKPVIISGQPRLAFARAARFLRAQSVSSRLFIQVRSSIPRLVSKTA